MLEELFHLLSQLGLGAAARPLCDLIAGLAGESMSLHLLEQEICNVLHRHGGAHCTHAVISALVELGFAGVSPVRPGEGGNQAIGTAAIAEILCGPLLPTATIGIVAEPRLSRSVPHESARRWLDIDGGIYFDARQHGAGSE